MAYFYEKPEGLDWETWNFSWRHKRSVVKKHLKIIFFSVQPFIVKMQFEIWKYLPSKLFLPKYLSCRLHNSVQLVPTILFTSFLQPASIETDPIANPLSAVDHIRTQIYVKSKTGKRMISKYSVWMRCQENGSRGKHFAKFP